MNKTLGVSALLIFICMLLGGIVFGFVGVLLAVPIAVILTMAFDKEIEN
jgi:predicted PurR-regulated permease PerM